MDGLPTTWRVQWQDYAGWRETGTKQPRPEIEFKDFASKEEAEDFKKSLLVIHPELVAQVAPLVPKQRRTKAVFTPGFDRARGGKRLTA